MILLAGLNNYGSATAFIVKHLRVLKFTFSQEIGCRRQADSIVPIVGKHIDLVIIRLKYFGYKAVLQRIVNSMVLAHTLTIFDHQFISRYVRYRQ